MTRILFSLVVIAVVIGGTTAAVVRQDTNEIQESTTVQIGSIQIEVNATGSVEPAREVPMQFEGLYEVAEVFVEEGDSVSAGDVMATLDITDYGIALARAETALARQQNNFDALVGTPRDVEVEVARAALEAAEAAAFAAWQAAPSDEEIEIARLEVERARNQLWQAQLQRDQVLLVAPEFRNLDPNTNAIAQDIQLNDGVDQVESGIAIAEQQFLDTQTQGPNGSAYGSAVEQIARAEVNLDDLYNPDARDVELAALGIHQAALDVENIETQLVDLQLVAPFDGVVIETSLTVGEIPPAGPAIVLADTTTFEVALEVDETDVIGMQSGMPVELAVDALPETTLNGQITAVSVLPIEDESVPTYNVIIQLDPSLEPIRSGMSATATVVTGELTDVMLLPNRYIQFTEEGEAFVFRVENEVTSRVPVTLGRRSDDLTQIVDGLEPGQRVVLSEVETGPFNLPTRNGDS